MLKVGDKVRIIGKSWGDRTEDIGKEDIIEGVNIEEDEYMIDNGIYPESSLQLLERQIEIRGRKFSEETIVEALKAHCNFNVDEYTISDTTIKIGSSGNLDIDVEDGWDCIEKDQVDELIEKLQLLRAKMR